MNNSLRILCFSVCTETLTTLGVFVHSLAKLAKQTACRVNRLTTGRLFVFEPEATLWNWEHRSFLILDPNTLSHLMSLCDCQLIKMCLQVLEHVLVDHLLTKMMLNELWCLRHSAFCDTKISQGLH